MLNNSGGLCRSFPLILSSTIFSRSILLDHDIFLLYITEKFFPLFFCAVHSFRKFLLHSIKLSKALYGTLFSFSMFPSAFPFHLLYSFSAIGNFTNTFIPHNSHSAWIVANPNPTFRKWMISLPSLILSMKRKFF